MIRKKIVDFFNKKLQIDIEYYIKGGFWLVLANVTIALVNVVALILFARLLSQDEFGKYKFFLSLIGVFSILSATGMDTAVLQSASRHNKYAYINSSKFRLKVSLLGSVAMLIATAYFYKISDPLWMVSAIGMFLFPFMFSFGGSIFFMYGLQKFTFASIFKVLTNLLPLFFVITLTILTRNVYIIIIAYMLAISLSHISIYTYIIKKVIPKIKNNVADKSMISYGKHLSLVNAITVVFNYFDKLLITYLMGYSSLAIYAIAESLPNQFKTQTKFIMGLVMPKMSKNSNLSFKHIQRYVLYAFLLSAAAISIIYLVLPPIITFLFGDKYISSIPFAQKLFLATIFWLPNTLLLSYFQSQKKMREIYTYRIVTPIVGLTLYLVLGIKFQMLGIVYAMILSQGFTFVFLILIASKKIELLRMSSLIRR
jgi:O-antigen/teichoic acid export membrane protein